MLIVFNFLVGYLAHGLKPWTDTFDDRTGNLVRYVIGAMLVLVLLYPVYAEQSRKHGREIVPFDEYTVAGIIAVAPLGIGVVVGYLLDRR